MQEDSAPEADASPDQESKTPLSSGGSATPSSVTLTVAPVEGVRGEPIEIRAAVTSREGPAPVLTVKLQGGPSGLTPGAPVTLTAGQSEATLSITAAESVAYGEVPGLQVVVDVPVLAEPFTVPVSLFLRGKPGAVDTTFGANGLAPNVTTSTLVDGALLPDGSLLVLGNTPLLVRYLDSGLVDAGYGSEGVRTVGFPAWSDGWASLGRLEVEESGTVTMPGLLRQAAGASLSFGRSSIGAAPPFAVEFTPASAPPSFPAAGAGDVPASVTCANGAGYIHVVGYPGTGGGTHVLKPFDANSTELSWSSGAASFSPTASSNFRTTADRLYLLRSWKPTQLPMHNEIQIRDRVSGAVFDKPWFYGRSDLGEVTEDGSVVIVSSGPRPCVHVARPSGVVVESPVDACVERDERSASGLLASDGKLALVAVGTTSTLWRAEIGGIPDDGVPLEGFDADASTKVVRIFEASRRRMVVLARSTGSLWIVRRFWL